MVRKDKLVRRPATGLVPALSPHAKRQPVRKKAGSWHR
jgi:hypothetical protein